MAFPLKQSGTGVAQVLTILAAVMTVDNATIIIDEINSFLHPAAVKSLLRIVQTEYSHHQYIIPTHSPDVIVFANPTTMHLVKRIGYETSIERVSLDSAEQLRDLPSHLGVSMSDVFAAERILWVEGPTEEMCFPFVYEQLIGPLPIGTLITSVSTTGDFGRKTRSRELVQEVYEIISEKAAPLLRGVAFSFDSEKLAPA